MSDVDSSEGVGNAGRVSTGDVAVAVIGKLVPCRLYPEGSP